MPISPGFVHAGLLSDRYNVALWKRSLDRGKGAPLPPLVSGGGVCVKWKVRVSWKGSFWEREKESERRKVGRTWRMSTHWFCFVNMVDRILPTHSSSTVHCVYPSLNLPQQPFYANVLPQEARWQHCSVAVNMWPIFTLLFMFLNLGFAVSHNTRSGCLCWFVRKSVHSLERRAMRPTRWHVKVNGQVKGL